MKSDTIHYNSSYKIENDFVVLDKFKSELETTRIEIGETAKSMHERIIALNENGFSDSNFANLYEVFTQNVGNISLVGTALQNFEIHIQGLSDLIKNYYKIEI